MCNCKDVKIGSYSNQVKLDAPKFMLPLKSCIGEIKEPFICIDKCLEDEIKYLWSLKIKTLGCCCGHNKLYAYIQVNEEYINKMIELGYKNDGVNNNSFYAKSIK